MSGYLAISFLDVSTIFLVMDAQCLSNGFGRANVGSLVLSLLVSGNVSQSQSVSAYLSH